MKVIAESRKETGSGASRRLRRAAKVPGILYGGDGQPVQIALDHNPLYHSLRVEAFHASILDMELDGKGEQVLLRRNRRRGHEENGRRGRAEKREGRTHARNVTGLPRPVRLSRRFPARRGRGVTGVASKPE